MPSPIQTLGQQRAAHAWKQVETVPAGEEFDQFSENAKKLPMRIRASGLGQSLAFLAAKKKAPALPRAINSWCKERGLVADSNDDAVSSRCRSGTAAELRLLTAEVLAYLEWLVRFADARKKD